MAPTKTVRNKHAVKRPEKGSSSGKPSSMRSTSLKSKAGKKPKLPLPKQQRTKPAAAQRRKQKTYTDKELGIPNLNMITPVGVEKPRGKKKGKVFVDDAESMMTILAMVNADKEGQIESKMMRARQMEEIRESRRKEAEKKEEAKREQLEKTKTYLRKERKRKSTTKMEVETQHERGGADRKRVSFA
ncbi:uncharacterized protein KY384_003769 [Bacidia gigantensis]|uniref:uncharacterized protein n=1 Tax=Bacidia gigantensis TaxID=2732470 RepID=UPI001D044483|nr:uncharacterized protein KY384_003769 [Bacidia gigantensis]KAG8532130.1 hypothetical protein KY384_003769 [Bacidia gigantensis]